VTDQGSRFYCNRETGVSSWERPAEVQAIEAEMAKWDQSVDAKSKRATEKRGMLISEEKWSALNGKAKEEVVPGTLNTERFIEQGKAKKLKIEQFRALAPHTSVAVCSCRQALISMPFLASVSSPSLLATPSSAACACYGSVCRYVHTCQCAGAMLEDCGVKAGSKWADCQERLADEPRYTALTTMVERRGAFEAFVRLLCLAHIMMMIRFPSGPSSHAATPEPSDSVEPA
jgi:hypothetical protein